MGYELLCYDRTDESQRKKRCYWQTSVHPKVKTATENTREFSNRCPPSSSAIVFLETFPCIFALNLNFEAPEAICAGGFLPFATAVSRLVC